MPGDILLGCEKSGSVHTAYFGRVYYWIEGLTVVSYHFDPNHRAIPKKTRYSPKGKKMTGGGYSRKSKRYRTAIRDRTFNLATDFGPRNPTGGREKTSRFRRKTFHAPIRAGAIAKDQLPQTSLKAQAVNCSEGLTISAMTLSRQKFLDARHYRARLCSGKSATSCSLLLITVDASAITLLISFSNRVLSRTQLVTQISSCLMR